MHVDQTVLGPERQFSSKVCECVEKNTDSTTNAILSDHRKNCPFLHCNKQAVCLLIYKGRQHLLSFSIKQGFACVPWLAYGKVSAAGRLALKIWEHMSARTNH